MAKARSGWYVLYPDGGAWVAAKIDKRGDCVALVEEANADTHLNADDWAAWVVRSIADGDVDENMTAEDAQAVISAVDDTWHQENVCVERIIRDERGDLTL